MSWHGAWLAPAVALSCLSLALPDGAGAQSIPGYPEQVTAYDPREVALLPKYCAYTQLFRDRVPGGNDPAQIARWHAAMGDVFIHMHHYCYGLMYLHRATVLARSADVRATNLNSAIVEFDYVIERAPADFALLPEILTRKGEAMLRQGRTVLALAELERAIELRPDYWPPYARISDYYRGVGETEKARAVLDRGLARAPDATGLRRRLAELDAAPSVRRDAKARVQ